MRISHLVSLICHTAVCWCFPILTNVFVVWAQLFIKLLPGVIIVCPPRSTIWMVLIVLEVETNPRPTSNIWNIFRGENRLSVCLVLLLFYFSIPSNNAVSLLRGRSCLSQFWDSGEKELKEKSCETGLNVQLACLKLGRGFTQTFSLRPDWGESFSSDPIWELVEGSTHILLQIGNLIQFKQTNRLWFRYDFYLIPDEFFASLLLFEFKSNEENGIF